MEKDIKREALRQYFKYFKIWFIIAGILAVITIGAAVVHALTPKPVRGNSQEPTERVYDYADMLTDEEEQSLREYIAECEEKIQADIVIVTISESVEYDLQDPDLPEAFHAKEVGSTDWSTAMRDLADNFYDYNNYGYNKVHGNGVLLLDNSYEGQKGSWLSTCGNVYDYFGDYEIDQALYAVDDYIDESPYRAYKNCDPDHGGEPGKHAYDICSLDPGRTCGRSDLCSGEPASEQSEGYYRNKPVCRR